MARSRASAKKAGTLFESQCAQYLTETLGTKVIRAPKNGAKDKGDIYGLEFQGSEVVMECKSPGRDVSWSLSGWWKETTKEMDNAETDLGILAVKRMGKSTEKSICIMDEERWERFNNGIHTPVVHKSIPNSTLGGVLDHDGVISVPRKGKQGLWIMTELSTVMNLFLHHMEYITVVLTEEQMNQYRQQHEIMVVSTDGQKIVLQMDSDMPVVGG